MKQMNWYIAVLVFGFWLLISPYILGFEDVPGAYWNAILVGLVITVGALVALYRNREDFPGSEMTHQAHKA